MIYPKARPRVKAKATFKTNTNLLNRDTTKAVAKALGEPTSKKALAQTTAYLDEEAIVTHQGKEYRCTVVRLFAPVEE